MPSALDRLLARPSALRLLRSIVHAPEPPTAYFASKCRRCKAPRRGYSSLKGTSSPPIRWVRSNEEFEKDQSRFERGRTVNNRNAEAQSLTAKDGNFLDGADQWILDRNAEGEEKDEAAIWAQKLYLRERVYGLNGVRQIWSACHGFDLPTCDTQDAEFLWGTFIKAPDLVSQVLDHAADIFKRTGHVYPHLYELCMGHWLPQDEHWGRVKDYHHRMVVKFKLQELPLRQLAQAGAHRFAPSTFDTFMSIYKISNERNVYDAVVPVLCARGSIPAARQWHTLCVQRGDLPSPHVAAQPLIQALASGIPATVEREMETFRAMSGGMRHGKAKMNESLIRRLQGRDTAPVRFEDSFCARMFATRAFPPDSIIRGLAMIGVNEVGPQAVRAMASRTDPISDLPQRFEELKTAGITLQGSVFSLAVEKFAAQGQWALARSILASDQHHDVYDDAMTQRELLDYYLQQHDFEQAHRTLAVLSLFHNDSSTEAWNLLLQAHIRRSEPGPVVRMLQSMRCQDVIVTSHSVRMIRTTFLRPRTRARKPGRSKLGRFDDLRFVTRVFITILEAGIGRVPPEQWREIVRRYGMLGRLRELRRLILWLLCWYAPRGGTKFDALPKSEFLDAATKKMRAAYPNPNYYFNFSSRISQTNERHPIRILFPNSLQQGIIVWGFRAGLLPNASLEQSMLSPIAAKKHHRSRLLQKRILNRLDWATGLRTLVELRGLGLHVHRHNVIKTVQAMFLNLFGHGRSNIKANRIMEVVNTIEYAKYVEEVNAIWGRPLFGVPRTASNSMLHGSMWHPRAERRVHRKEHLSLDEIVGPSWRNVGLASRKASRENAQLDENSVAEYPHMSFLLPAHASEHHESDISPNLPKPDQATTAQRTDASSVMERAKPGVGELRRAFVAHGEAMNIEADAASGLGQLERAAAMGNK